MGPWDLEVSPNWVRKDSQKCPSNGLTDVEDWGTLLLWCARESSFKDNGCRSRKIGLPWWSRGWVSSLPMQRTQVQYLVWEDFCRQAAEPYNSALPLQLQSQITELLWNPLLKMSDSCVPLWYGHIRTKGMLASVLQEFEIRREKDVLNQPTLVNQEW